MRLNDRITVGDIVQRQYDRVAGLAQQTLSYFIISSIITFLRIIQIYNRQS